MTVECEWSLVLEKFGPRVLNRLWILDDPETEIWILHMMKQMVIFQMNVLLHFGSIGAEKGNYWSFVVERAWIQQSSPSSCHWD
tara:strand:- start:262 stop:513 length:252 start_codon:yes stop_codon:yes gene_type:complete